MEGWRIICSFQYKATEKHLLMQLFWTALDKREFIDGRSHRIRGGRHIGPRFHFSPLVKARFGLGARIKKTRLSVWGKKDIGVGTLSFCYTISDDEHETLPMLTEVPVVCRRLFVFCSFSGRGLPKGK
jgi:hypothetical protein